MDHADNSAVGVDAVSCPTPSFCAAVDGSGHALLLRHGTWGRPKVLDSDPYGFTSVSCSSAEKCVAADTQGDVDVWNGRRWSALKAVDPASNPDSDQMAVSCPSNGFCAAVDTDGHELVDRHGHWAITNTSAKLDAISCSGPSWCVAGGFSGKVTDWNGSAWSAATTADPRGDQIDGVSCASRSFCVAAGNDMLSWNGRHWSAPQQISPSTVESVSCPTLTFCLAGDSSIGRVYRWHHRRWRHDTTFRHQESVESISCPHTDFCIAVGDGHQVHARAVPPTVRGAQLPHATVDRGYHHRLRVRGGHGRLRWSKTGGSLPPGVALTRAGVVRGTPTRRGAYRFKVQVRDALGIASRRQAQLRVQR
jgi:hypothetical protein